MRSLPAELFAGRLGRLGNSCGLVTGCGAGRSGCGLVWPIAALIEVVRTARPKAPPASAKAPAVPVIAAIGAMAVSRPTAGNESRQAGIPALFRTTLRIGLLRIRRLMRWVLWLVLWLMLVLL